MAFQDRYAAAVNSSNLKSADDKGAEGSSVSDTDALGAMALADRSLTEGRLITGPGEFRPIAPSPLSAAIARLLQGDDRAVTRIIGELAEMTFEQSWRIRLKINRHQAKDIATACFAWFRNGTCKACGGHGKTLIKGTKTLSDHDCQPCRGTGRMLFEPQFAPEHRNLARWVASELGRSAGRAFDIAARKIAPTLDL
jgi:hypothetical protein